MAGYGRRAQAIGYLLSGESVKDAARCARVGERTLFRWMSEPEFSQALKSAQDELVSRASRLLTSRGEQAINTLTELLDAGYSASIRLRAAQAILALALEYHEAGSFVARLDALEKRIDESETRETGKTSKQSQYQSVYRSGW